MKKALVCTLSGIGNAIHTLPLIEALYSMGYVVDVKLNSARGAEPIFEAYPHVLCVFTEKRQQLAVYDNVFCCSYCNHNLELKGCGSINNHTPDPLLHGDGKTPISLLYNQHEIDYFMDLARRVGFRGKAPKVYLPTKRSPVDIPKRAVAISIGYYKGDIKERSRAKHWGNFKFVKLAIELIRNKYVPVFIGSSDDWDRDGHVIQRVLDAQNLATKALFLFSQGLLESFGALKQCCAYVGNETCMVPAAAALNKPTMSMSFSEAPESIRCPIKNYPYPNGTVFVGTRLQLTPKAVVKHLMKLIKEGPSKRIINL